MTRVNNASNSDQSQQQLPEPLEKKKFCPDLSRTSCELFNFLFFHSAGRENKYLTEGVSVFIGLEKYVKRGVKRSHNTAVCELNRHIKLVSKADGKFY